MGAQPALRSAPGYVVVADDTAFVRDRFRDALGRAGHRVRTASTKAELFECLRDRGEASLVVLDVALSGASASALVRGIRALAPDVPIVALSGTIASAGTVRALSDLNVTAFINEYTIERNIVPALQPLLRGGVASRRASPRAPLGASVSIRFNHTISSAVTLNIGRGGVAIKSANPLPVGSQVSLRLRLPSGHTLEAGACVVWSDSNVGMGLRFVNLGSVHQARVDEFVESSFFTSRKG